MFGINLFGSIFDQSNNKPLSEPNEAPHAESFSIPVVNNDQIEPAERGEDAVVENHDVESVLVSIEKIKKINEINNFVQRESELLIRMRDSQAITEDIKKDCQGLYRDMSEYVTTLSIDDKKDSEVITSLSHLLKEDNNIKIELLRLSHTPENQDKSE
jgi:hypothetical protein